MSEPRLKKIFNGWAAYGDGWAVHGKTEEEARRLFELAEQKHREIAARAASREAESSEGSADS